MFQKGEKWNGNKNGRPKGKSFRDYFNDKEITELVAFAKITYKKKPEILRLVIEQVFGKPAQNLTMNGNLSLKIEFDAAFNSSQQTKTDSGQSGEVQNSASGQAVG